MDRKVLAWCRKRYPIVCSLYQQSPGLTLSPRKLSLIRERKVFPERTDPEGFLTVMVRTHAH